LTTKTTFFIGIRIHSFGSSADAMLFKLVELFFKTAIIWIALLLLYFLFSFLLFEFELLFYKSAEA